MAHALASLQYIKERVPEPWRQALLTRAVDKGVSYKLRCINTGIITKVKEDGSVVKVRRGMLRTKFAGVERCFKIGQEMELPAMVASFLWDKFNISMVGGSAGHRSTTDAPFDGPCFEEIVDETRTDLGPELDLRPGGVAAQEDLISERRGPSAMGRASRVTSDEPSADEISSVAGGGARPAGGSGV